MFTQAAGSPPLIYWILHQENRNELKKRRSQYYKSKQISLSQQIWQKLYFLIEKFFSKTAQNTTCTLIKLAQKTQPATAKNFPQRNEKTSPIVRENRPTGNTEDSRPAAIITLWCNNPLLRNISSDSCHVVSKWTFSNDTVVLGEE